MIKERSDLNFLFLIKRIERFYKCIPQDWENGHENVIICATVENQILEQINIEKYLDNIELVVVGGESDKNARILNYDCVLYI